MACDRENQDDHLRNQVSELLAAIVTGSRETRSLACESLSRLLVSKDAVVSLLRRERAVGQESVFLGSLRLDAAREAVTCAVAELFSRIDATHGRREASMSAEWFIHRVGELSLGIANAMDQPRTGSVMHLFDGGLYERGRRSSSEEQMISLFDEAAASPDEFLREKAFERLWNWSRQLALSQCRDPHVADDVATEAVLRLLRHARSIRGANHPYSGIDVARRVRTMILGPFRTSRRKWRGLVASVMARRERPFRDVNLTEDEVAGAIDDHTTGIRQGPHAFLASSGDISLLFHQAMREHLGQCREQLCDCVARQVLGERAQRTLETILDVLARRVSVAQYNGQRAASFVVVESITRWNVDPSQALPALQQVLPIKRPRAIARRLRHIRDQLLITGLVDRHLAPRTARPGDLFSMLENLDARCRLPELMGHRRQQQTISGVVTFWRSSLEQLVDSLDGRAIAVTLPPLLVANQRLSVSPDVLDAMEKQLHINRNAAHNAVKRHLSMLTDWGMVQEIEDSDASD